MKVTLVTVMSIDAKITKWDIRDVHSWTSPEDKSFFSSLINKSEVLIMGRKTYDSAKASMKLSPTTLRVVLTSDPSKYADTAVPNQLEFTAETPSELLKILEARGFKSALLLGGGEMNTLFLRSNLVNEIWLTVEPVILGSGKSLLSEEELDIKLKLQSIEKLNEKGTMLLKYKVQ